MKRSIWNMVVDALSLLVFTTMISTGLLLKYILPPGSGRVDVVLGSRGRGHQTIDLFMGLARHDWGVIHFYLSLGFLALLIVHLALHWNWIVSMLWGTKGKAQSPSRRYMTIGIVVCIVTVLAFPWIGSMAGLKQTLTRNELQQKVRP